jgi:hypothetical protein
LNFSLSISHDGDYAIAYVIKYYWSIIFLFSIIFRYSM